MRLLIVSQYFWPEHFRINELSQLLSRDGWQVTVLTGTPNYPDGVIFPEFATEPERFSSLGDVKIVRIPVRPRGRGNFNLMLNYLSFAVSGSILGVRALRGRNFDAIFMFETSPITSALPALILRRLKRAPVLMWVLDLWPESLSAVGAVRSPWVLAAVSRLVRFIYKRTDLILIQSESFRSSVERHGGSFAHMRYFPAWAEISGLRDDVRPPAEMVPFRDTFNIVFAGNIGDAQDFPSILDAAADLSDCPQVRWLIVGSGRGESALRADIAARKLEHRVFLLGRHPVERMPEFFAGADAMLVSLRADPVFAMTIPGKVQTYLASKRPLLAMLDGEGRRIIEEAGAGLTCAAGEGKQLAGRVRDLLAMSPDDRAAMGARGVAYGLKHFDRDMLIANLRGWISELVSARMER